MSSFFMRDVKSFLVLLNVPWNTLRRWDGNDLLARQVLTFLPPSLTPGSGSLKWEWRIKFLVMFKDSRHIGSKAVITQLYRLHSGDMPASTLLTARKKTILLLSSMMNKLPTHGPRHPTFFLSTCRYAYA
jgi:hypothetical protein